VVTPEAIIAEKIVARYGHPARTAYLYLFQLIADADRSPLIPRAEAVLGAWIDEGMGVLQPADAANALERCAAARDLPLTRPATPHERRLFMARVVTFTFMQGAPDEHQVILISRALRFTPKGDRTAIETWRPAEGSWYSAYTGPDL